MERVPSVEPHPSPTMSIARIRHVAMPLLGIGNDLSSAWCIRPGRPESLEALRWEQPGGRASEGARTLANDCSPEMISTAEAAAVGVWRDEPVLPGVSPMSAGKKRVKAPAGRHGVGVRAASQTDCRDNVGKIPLPAGADSNLQRPQGRAEAKPGGGFGIGAWARKSYEEEVTLFEVTPEVTSSEVTPQWGIRGPRHLAGSVTGGGKGHRSHNPVASERRRIVDQTCGARGACESALKLRRRRKGSTETCQGRQPDSGNPTVRDENGGSEKRDSRRNCEPTRHTERAGLETLCLPMRALCFYPNPAAATQHQWC